MILFTILVLIACIAAFIAILFIGAVGGAIVVFLGDILLFGLIVWLIIRLISLLAG